MEILLTLCINHWALYYDIPVKLINAVIKVESNGNHLARSPDKGDIGLMQVRHKYVKETKVELMKPCKNIEVGVRILREMRQTCHLKDKYKYVICYNRGVRGAKRVIHPSKDKYYLNVLRRMK